MIINQKNIKLSEVKAELELCSPQDQTELFKFGYHIFLHDFFDLLFDMAMIFQIDNDTSNIDLEVVFETALDHIGHVFKNLPANESLLVWRGIAWAEETISFALKDTYQEFINSDKQLN